MRNSVPLAMLLAVGAAAGATRLAGGSTSLPPGHMALSLEPDRWAPLRGPSYAPLSFYCLLSAPQIRAESLSFRIELSPGGYFLGSELAPGVTDLDPTPLGFHLVLAAGCDSADWPVQLVAASALFFGEGMIRLFGPQPALVFPSRPSYRPCGDDLDLPLTLGEVICEETYPHYPRGALVIGGHCVPPIDRSPGEHVVEVGLTAVAAGSTSSVPLRWGGVGGWSEVDDWCVPLPPIASLTFTAQWDSSVAECEWMTAGPPVADWSVQQTITANQARMVLEHRDQPLLAPDGSLLAQLGMRGLSERGVLGIVTTIDDVREAHGEMCNVFRGEGQLRVGCQLRDVRADSQLDVGDAVLAHRIWGGTLSPSFEHVCAADVDGDLAVELPDVEALLDAAVEGDGASPAAFSSPATASADAALLTITLQVEAVHGLLVRVQLEPVGQRLVGFMSDSGQLRAAVASSGVARVALSDSIALPRTITVLVETAGANPPPRVTGLTGYDAEGAAFVPSFEVVGAVVAAPPANGTPAAARLLGASPNPFNPRTTLRFTLARPGNARLTIFDSHGRLVRRFVLPVMDAGVHEVQWDGLDHQGHRLASGVYRLHLEGPEVDGRASSVVLLR